MKLPTDKYPRLRGLVFSMPYGQIITLTLEDGREVRFSAVGHLGRWVKFVVDAPRTVRIDREGYTRPPKKPEVADAGA